MQAWDSQVLRLPTDAACCGLGQAATRRPARGQQAASTSCRQTGDPSNSCTHGHVKHQLIAPWTCITSNPTTPTDSQRLRCPQVCFCPDLWVHCGWRLRPQALAPGLHGSACSTRLLRAFCPRVRSIGRCAQAPSRLHDLRAVLTFHTATMVSLGTCWILRRLRLLHQVRHPSRPRAQILSQPLPPAAQRIAALFIHARLCLPVQNFCHALLLATCSAAPCISSWSCWRRSPRRA